MHNLKDKFVHRFSNESNKLIENKGSVLLKYDIYPVLSREFLIKAELFAIQRDHIKSIR